MNIKYLTFILILICAIMLIPSLRRAARIDAQIVHTMDALQQIKEEIHAAHHANRIIENRRQQLSHGLSMITQVHQSGTIMAERVMQVTLTKVEPDVCRGLIHELVKQQDQALWRRIEVNGLIFKSQLSSAARKNLCNPTAQISVYFRF